MRDAETTSTGARSGEFEPIDFDATCRLSDSALRSVSHNASSTLVLILKGKVQEIVIPDDRSLDIGRDKLCEVFINDTSISRRHLRIQTARLPTATDLGSTNGTTLDGLPMKPHQPTTLGLNSVLQFGTVTAFVKPSDPMPEAELKSDVDAGSHGIISRSSTTVEAMRLARSIAVTDIPTILLGETGSGKEVFATEIHRRSKRNQRRLVSINCAALPDTLLESELFGHERGAFSGAVKAKPGLFEVANGGTLFLDEVGELPLAIQAKLLRILECGEVQRLGSTSPRPISVRIICATNRELDTHVERGLFRADLFYRLNGFTIRISPLRDRVEEIAPLALLFSSEFERESGSPMATLSDEFLRELELYNWPGNVRELKNTVRRVLALERGPVVGREMAPVTKNATERSSSSLHTRAAMVAKDARNRRSIDSREGDETVAGEQHGSLQEELSAMERHRILTALADCAGNQSRAAKVLGITRRMLMTRLDQYKIQRPRASSRPKALTKG
jgi:two-component system, NtrC family, response regulator AtoC